METTKSILMWYAGIFSVPYETLNSWRKQGFLTYPLPEKVTGEDLARLTILVVLNRAGFRAQRLRRADAVIQRTFRKAKKHNLKGYLLLVADRPELLLGGVGETVLYPLEKGETILELSALAESFDAALEAAAGVKELRKICAKVRRCAAA